MKYSLILVAILILGVFSQVPDYKEIELNRGYKPLKDKL